MVAKSPRIMLNSGLCPLSEMLARCAGYVVAKQEEAEYNLESSQS